MRFLDKLFGETNQKEHIKQSPVVTIQRVNRGFEYLVGAPSWVCKDAIEAQTRAEEHTRSGSVAEAVEDLRSAHEAQPDWCMPLYNLGVLLYGQRIMEHALGCFLAALKCKPLFPPIFFNLSSIYRELGQTDPAIEAIVKYIEYTPEDPEGHHALGCLYMKKGDEQAEIQAYQNALKAGPRFHMAHLNLGITYRDRRNFDAGEYHLQWAVETAPNKEMAMNAQASLNELHRRRG